MAFNNVGPVTNIAPGVTHNWWFTRNGGQDYGAQYGAPHIKTPNQGPRLNVFNQGKRKLNNDHTTYYCSIRNTSSNQGCFYNLQGGGFA